jgi:23S rRNA pseudouridine2605 synthase
MAQLRRGARLAEEPVAQLVIAAHSSRQELDRDRTIERDVTREKDDTHPATTDLALERVSAGQRALQRDELRGRRFRHGEKVPARAGRGEYSTVTKRESSGSAGTVSIARALSKLGVCSRAEGERAVRAGRVGVNGAIVHQLSFRVVPETDRIEIDGVVVGKASRVYIALNKPRGLVTTRDDPEGRATIYESLAGADLPFVGPVGRLDKASEGLLLLTNDTQWANALIDPESHVEKTYHVQAKTTESARVLESVKAGVKSIELLRSGSRSTAWFTVVLDEGKNRQIRRLFEAIDVEVLRLVRVAIGPLELGALAKGEWRHLTASEVAALRKSAAPRARARSR